MSNNDREESLATYYAMVLRSRGASPLEAARRVVQRYPRMRARLEREGLLKAPERSGSWTSEVTKQILSGNIEFPLPAESDERNQEDLEQE